MISRFCFNISFGFISDFNSFNHDNEIVDVYDFNIGNSDGEISVLDVIIVLNCIIDDDGCDYICMDYNEDTNIDIMDIILMINIILDN